MDCSDGVCGTCKCRCGGRRTYDLGDEYIDDALIRRTKPRKGLVLTCQMVPSTRIA